MFCQNVLTAVEKQLVYANEALSREMPSEIRSSVAGHVEVLERVKEILSDAIPRLNEEGEMTVTNNAWDVVTFDPKNVDPAELPQLITEPCRVPLELPQEEEESDD